MPLSTQDSKIGIDEPSRKPDEMLGVTCIVLVCHPVGVTMFPVPSCHRKFGHLVSCEPLFWSADFALLPLAVGCGYLLYTSELYYDFCVCVWTWSAVFLTFCLLFFRPWYRALVFLLTHSAWKVRQNAQSCVQRLFNALGEGALELQCLLLKELSKLIAQQKVNLTASYKCSAWLLKNSQLEFILYFTSDLIIFLTKYRYLAVKWKCLLSYTNQ